MANYIIRSCDGIFEYVVDDSIEPGLTANTYSIVFTGESSQSCFNVISATTDPITEGINSLTGYSNCLECIQQNDFSILSFDCLNPENSGPFPSQYFNELPFGNFYKICVSEFDPPCICIGTQAILPFSTPPIPFEVTITGPFSECGCESLIPVSAGTEYFVCQICSDSSGATATQISVPHPVWTRPNGQEVTLLDAVQLGGMFGLNS